MTKRFVFLVTVSLLLSLFSTASYGGTPLTGATNDWPPFADPKSDGGGLALEIVKAAFQTQGVDVTYEFMPWTRVENGLKEGLHDFIVNVWMRDERKEFFLYSEPYSQNNTKFIKRKGSDFEYEGLDSLTGLTVGVVQGYNYGDEFLKNENFTVESSSSLLLNIRKLMAERIDLTMEDEIVARSALSREAPEMLEQIEFVENPLYVEDLYIAFSITDPNAESNIALFNKGLKEIKENGTYQSILEKYGF